MKSKLIYLKSVGTLIDEHTLDTVPAPFMFEREEYLLEGLYTTVMVATNVEIDEDEAIDLEVCSDEWLENLSAEDIKIIVYLTLRNHARYETDRDEV